MQGDQEREIVRVVMDCCVHETAYNPFYALLLVRLATHSRVSAHVTMHISGQTQTRRTRSSIGCVSVVLSFSCCVCTESPSYSTVRALGPMQSVQGLQLRAAVSPRASQRHTGRKGGGQSHESQGKGSTALCVPVRYVKTRAAMWTRVHLSVCVCVCVCVYTE